MRKMVLSRTRKMLINKRHKYRYENAKQNTGIVSVGQPTYVQSRLPASIR